MIKLIAAFVLGCALMYIVCLKTSPELVTVVKPPKESAAQIKEKIHRYELCYTIVHSAYLKLSPSDFTSGLITVEVNLREIIDDLNKKLLEDQE